MVSLGLVSAILPEQRLEEVFAFAAETGFDTVELMCWPKGKAERRYAGVTHLEVAPLEDAEAERLRGLMALHGIGVSGLGYYPNPLDPDPDKAAFHRDHIKNLILAAESLGIPVVNTFVGRNPSLDVEENIALFRKEWPPIVAFAEDHGVRIGIENCPMYFTRDEWPGGKNMATTPAIWDRLFEIIPSPAFGLNYDPSHMVWQMMDPLKPLQDYRDRLHHIHLKDAKVHRERLDRVGIMATPLEFHSPRIPGRGDLDWKAFIGALAGCGYQGAACIEVEDKDYEGSEADVRTAIRMAYSHIRQYLPKG